MKWYERVTADPEGSINRLAARSGLSVEELENRHQEIAQEFRGDNGHLTLNDWHAFENNTGSLPADKADHLDSCGYCKGLVSAFSNEAKNTRTEKAAAGTTRWNPEPVVSNTIGERIFGSFRISNYAMPITALMFLAFIGLGAINMSHNSDTELVALIPVVDENPVSILTAAAVETAAVEYVAVEPAAVEPAAVGDTFGVSLKATSTTSTKKGGVSYAVPSSSPEVDALAAPIGLRAVENENWVLFQDPKKFTIQLATSREHDYILDLAQALEGNDPVAIYPFQTSSQNHVFGLLNGLYDNHAEAMAAVEDMSEETKQFGVWIRPVSDLQQEMERSNQMSK